MSVSYQTNVLSAFGNLAIPDTANYFLSNTFDTSTRYTPYMELIFQINEGDTAYAIYNTFLKYVSDNLAIVETNDASQLIIPSTSKEYYSVIYINDKRFYVVDSQMYYGYIDTTFGPSNLFFQYVNNKNAICKVPNGNGVTPSSSGVYAPAAVTRNTVFWYYPGSAVYLLIDFNNYFNTSYGFTIYVMESFCRQVSPITTEQLPLLAELLENPAVVGTDSVLPSNFVYSYLILPKTIYLNVVSVGTGYTIQDGCNCVYSYLDPSYSNIIYEQYTTKKESFKANSTTECKTTFKNDTTVQSSTATASSTATGNTVVDTFQSSADSSINTAQETSLNILLGLVPDTNGTIESICTTTTKGII